MAMVHAARWVERRLCCPEFYGVVPLSAVGVLWLNDAVLKARFHNALTGKLSDVAGCFVLPLFVSAVLALFDVAPRQRIATGALVTALFFSAIKLSADAGRVVCDVLEPVAQTVGAGSSLRIIADPTDLIALVAIPFAVAFANRRTGGVS